MAPKKHAASRHRIAVTVGNRGELVGIDAPEQTLDARVSLPEFNKRIFRELRHEFERRMQELIPVTVGEMLVTRRLLDRGPSGRPVACGEDDPASGLARSVAATPLLRNAALIAVVTSRKAASMSGHCVMGLPSLGVAISPPNGASCQSHGRRAIAEIDREVDANLASLQEVDKKSDGSVLAPEKCCRACGYLLAVGIVWPNRTSIGATISGLQNFRPLICFERGAKLRDHHRACRQMRFLCIEDPKESSLFERRHVGSHPKLSASCIRNNIDETIDGVQATE